MWVLDYKESWAPKNWCFWTVILEKTLEDRLNFKEIQPVHSKRKSVLNIHWKDWCWSWNSNTLATWCEELTHLKRPWKMAGGEGDDREWGGWMALLTWYTWVWASSGCWWRTGKPGVPQSMGSQRVRYDWVTQLTELRDYLPISMCLSISIFTIYLSIYLSIWRIDSFHPFSLDGRTGSDSKP